MFCKIVEQMFYKVAGLGHRSNVLTGSLVLRLHVYIIQNNTLGSRRCMR